MLCDIFNFMFNPVTPPFILHGGIMGQIKYINLEDISLPEFDGRLESDNEADIELSESIKELGVLEPIIVRHVNDRIEIIAGSCRYRASKIAGLSAIPCIIVKADDRLAEKIKLHENLKRLPLSHVDQAVTFARLRTEFGLSETEISIICGKSVPYISQHICMLDSGPEIIQAVQGDKIKFSVARELMHVKTDSTRQHLLNYAIKDGASVDTVKNWVSQSNNEEEMIDIRAASGDPPAPPSNISYTTFVCNTCETPAEIVGMHILRLCDHCFNSIMSDIKEAKRLASP